MALSTIQGFAEQVKNVAATASDATRIELISQLRRLTDSLETQNDVIHRFGYLHLQTAAVRTGFNIGLFKYLARNAGPASLDQISKATGAEYLLLSRLTSYLAAIGAIDETAQYQYGANSITQHLTSELAEAEISFCFDTCAPLFQNIPPHLVKNGHKSPTEETKTVFQDAWKTDKVAYEWMGAHPDHLVHLNKYMELRMAGAESWLSVYPVGEETKGFDGKTPIYVNIGGGVGHSNAQFAEQYSHLPGDNILQDLPASIENALPTPGVKNEVHNFFEDQPVKGAKFYYLRKVLHNHPQHESKKVLERTKEAMGPDSVILIDEIVLPTKGSNAYARSLDFTMLAAHAAMERTEALWKELIESAGLKLHKTYLYNAENYESIIDVRLP